MKINEITQDKWIVRINDRTHSQRFGNLNQVRKFLRSIASGQIRVSKAGRGWNEESDHIFAWETDCSQRNFEIIKDE